MKDFHNINKILNYFDDWSDEDKDIMIHGRILMDFHRKIEMHAESLDSRFGVPLAHINILEILYCHPENQLTPAELADEIHMTRSTMTGNLDSMQENGLIERKSHPSDRRMTLITITEKGIEFLKETIPVKYSDMLRVMKTLTADERKIMINVYRKLLKTIKEIAMEGIN